MSAYPRACFASTQKPDAGSPLKAPVAVVAPAAAAPAAPDPAVVAAPAAEPPAVTLPDAAGGGRKRARSLGDIHFNASSVLVPAAYSRAAIARA